MNENKEKIDKLAKDILMLARNTVLVNLRFLDVSISQFEYHSIDGNTLMTDGKNMMYNPLHVLISYKEERETIVRDYLHMVMHCIFRHMYVDPDINRTYWDLACDVAVENVITDLNIKAFAAKRQKEQEKYIEEIKENVSIITAEKVYNYLLEKNMTDGDVYTMREAFLGDDHSLWYMYVQGDSEDTDDSAEDSKETEVEKALRKAQEALWQEIAEQVQLDLETFGKDQGYGNGNLTKNLQAVNREKYDYTAFLKKFAVMDESVKINDDEFDYIFYTYGMELYENMPLIEPLEYKETKQIKEFVIAIDTSGSTSAELVQKFVQKTYNVLKSTESFFSKINLHIIQSDDKVQEDKKITCQEDFDEYMKNMEIHGLGGTDFRPVFKYVDKLVKNHEFTNLKGLIYFTDGFGEFPVERPDYDTAFIYLDDDYGNPDVPPWAIKLVLQKDEI